MAKKVKKEVELQVESAIEQPVEKQEGEPIKFVGEVIVPVTAEPVEPTKEPVVEPLAQDKPLRDKIIDYVNSQDGDVRLNGFLKIQYPVPSFREPAQWLELGSAKQLKGELCKMVSDGDIEVINDAHLKLGSTYYKGESQLRAHHTIDTIQLVVKKCNN